MVGESNNWNRHTGIIDLPVLKRSNTAGAQGGAPRRRLQRAHSQKKKTKVGATVEPTLGILLRLEVGPEEGYDEPVGKSEMTTVGATV
jgi:hypothetical protein